MTAVALPPWRVRVRTTTHTWLSTGMTEDAAVRVTGQISAKLAREIGDGPGMLPFLTKHGVLAQIRGRDVVAVEPVGPRWGTDEQPAARQTETPTPALLAAAVLAARTRTPSPSGGHR